jgi:peptidoglycan lytic transglycosylase B
VNRYRRSFLLSVLAFAAAAHARANTEHLVRDDVRQFIDELVETHGFDRTRLKRWLKEARYSATVEKLMQPPIPFGQRNWLDYRKRYLDELRIRAGIAFWQAHRDALTRAEQQFGVPAAILVAIIGVESYFGRTTGEFRTIDVLMTLSFDYLRRADFYRAEFVEFLLLAREQKRDPLSYRGSFAGAMGLPQFMPGSVRRWALDFDGDGRIDLLASPVDAIGSVANFLQAHGWQRELPVEFPAQADEAIVDALGRGIVAQTPWWSALAEGVVADASLALETPVLVIDLPIVDDDGQPGRHYRVGTVNFSAILHYNRSYFYAAAVSDYAAALQGQFAAGS